MLGNVVSNLVNANQSSGSVNQSNGTLLIIKVASIGGCLFIQIQAGDFVDTRKMILLNDRHQHHNTTWFRRKKHRIFLTK